MESLTRYATNSAPPSTCYLCLRTTVTLNSGLKTEKLDHLRVVVFDHALELYERFSLSHWDSLLLAACADAGVTRLYSEDMQHGTDIDGVKIINPFKV